ncbi:integrase core domain-containing protein, partial [Chlorobium limicola]
KGYETAVEMMRGFAEYFRFYNIERPHQSLGYKTPDEVYESAIGGGARIVDKFSKSVSEGSSEATGPQQEAA